MTLTNKEKNEIIFCEFQIYWRKQDLIILENEITNTQWRSDSGILNEKGLGDLSIKIGNLENKIQQYKKRLNELRKKA